MRHLIALIVAFAALALPAGASADPDAVVRDCAEDGSVDGNYSDSDKRGALNRIPADLDEYSDCRSLIAASIGGGPKAKKSGAIRDAGGAGAAAATTDRKRGARKRRAAAERKRRRSATEAVLGDRNIDPRSTGVVEASDTSNGLSLPVVLALIALGVFLVGASLLALARRNGGLSAVFRRASFARSRR